jgi:pyridinium-3,5-biscarboxylic acid mononucleotide sulfurtransferase
MNATEKYESLITYIKSFDSMSIALSGGIDSTFLLHVANEALGHENIMALTIQTAYLPERDLNDASEFCKNLNIRHIIIESPVPEYLRPNPVDRCYYCKRFEFSIIIAKAKEYGIDYVAAGLNAEDPSDYRPGIKAMNELNVLFPLQAVSLTKPEIRELAQRENIPLWNKPANACILSRIPYGDFITDETINRIQEAEKILQHEGFVNPRVRTHGKNASIEVEKDEMVKFTNEEISLRIFDALKKLGYQNITLDSRGYRTGSLNEGIIGQLKK